MGLIYVPSRRIQTDFGPDFPVEINWRHPLVEAGDLLYAQLPDHRYGIATPKGRAGVYATTFDIPTSDSARKGLLVAGLYRPTASSSAYGQWLAVFRNATLWTDVERVILTAAADGTTSHSAIAHNGSGTSAYSMGLPSASVSAVTQYAIEYDGSISEKYAYAWRDGTKQAAFYTTGTFPWNTGVTRGATFGNSGLSIYATYGYLFGPNAKIAIADILSELRKNPYQIWQPVRGKRIWVPVGGATAVDSDLSDSYVLRAAVSSDLADSYAIRAAIAADLADSYAVLSSVAADLADSYAITASVNADLADSYLIRASVAQDLSDSYALRSSVASDLADSYTIEVAGTVSSDLADSYLIRSAIASDLSDSAAIRAAVLADIADEYTVRSSVSQDLADQYTLINAVQADLDDSYIIRAAVAQDLIDSYTVFSGSGTGATAEEIWAVVMDGSLTASEMMRIMFAALAGKREGIGTATERYYGQDGVTPRITLTPDQYGNGTPVVDGS